MCQCELVSMRKTRGGCQRERRETGWRDRNTVNRHSRKRERKRKREEEVIKHFQRSKFPEGYYSWCGEHTSLAQPR